MSHDNDGLLQAGFRNDWRRALIVSFPDDPGDVDGWPSHSVGALMRRGAWPLNGKWNNYFCVSLFHGEHRRETEFEALCVLAVDDVGKKVDAGRLLDRIGTPSWAVETSPGNQQWFWWLWPWVTDLAKARALTRLVQGNDARSVTRVMRLPEGRNRKISLGLGPEGYQVRNAGGQVAAVVDPDELFNLHGVTSWDAAGSGVRSTVPGASVEALLGDDLVGGWLLRMGRVKGLTSNRLGVEIVCPWQGMHTIRTTTGTAYFPKSGGFECHHGHCAGKTGVDLRKWLEAEVERSGLWDGGIAGSRFSRTSAAAQDAGDADDAVGLILGTYEATEDGLALAFADEQAGRLRFDHTRGKWFRWAGWFWRQDEVQCAFRWARRLTREFRRGLVDASASTVRTLGKIAVAGAVERAARADEKLAVSGRDWDADPWIAGCPDGEVNLRTGEVVAGDPGHGVTKQLSVRPDVGCATPLWDRFLWDATGGDAEMIRFLQAWAGYCLCGDVSEERFVFMWGPGGNGKGTFLHTVTAILGDYAARTSAEVFMVRKHEVHPEEVARLAGVRSVVASEIEDGRTFNAVRLKDFTGRDGKLTGRFMRENTFEFVPQFKVTFVGNHQPRLADVDDAMRRRLVLVPFVQTPSVVNTDLKDQLVDEYPGILWWMIQGGCRRLAVGLSSMIPASAAAATRAYFDEQDTLRTWAGERCGFEALGRMGVTEGFEDYRMWCAATGETLSAIGIRDFTKRFLIVFPQCRKIRENNGNVIGGVSLFSK